MIVNVDHTWGAKIKSLLLGKEQEIKSVSSDFSEILSRGMLYPREFTTNRVVFLGINPSFRTSIDKKFGFNEVRYEEEIFKIPAEERYVFFKVFESAFGDFPWTHYDMLPFRERNQKMISKLFEEKNSMISELLLKFILLSKEIIEKSKPSVLVVSNAYVRNMFSYGSSVSASTPLQVFKTEFSKNLGTHVITEGKLINTPVFFSSMLSGQRAMDLGSRERMKWHIKMIIEKKFKLI